MLENHGGEYKTQEGRVKKIDETKQQLVLDNNISISILDIVDIKLS